MIRYFSGIEDAEYTIGAEYINIRMTNGMANLTSRNRIASADSHMPIPAGTDIIITRKSGEKSRVP